MLIQFGRENFHCHINDTKIFLAYSCGHNNCQKNRVDDDFGKESASSPSHFIRNPDVNLTKEFYERINSQCRDVIRSVHFTTDRFGETSAFCGRSSQPVQLPAKLMIEHITDVFV